ncbi:MAG TPA: sugar phosphate isomerase/epimerase [Candidatus Cybelea sp.]|jgi:sugar phosphate isomerase/epimerase|nr:sugar phosphate isomerase/epimerase [Candidatus Cybelea sp.]
MKTPHFFASSGRRHWFAGMTLLTGAALLAGCALFHPHAFNDVAGLQLYSVREQMSKDVPGTLAEVHAWGIKYVELAGTYGLTPPAFKAQLAEHELDAVSGHFSFKEWSENPEGVLFQARDLGLVDVGCPWIDHEGAFDEKACRHAIEVFNNAGALAKLHHMTFFYHTHGYEFQPYGKGTLFDLLVRETNPANVKFEMDIFWVVHAGQDPVKLLKKYPGRWELMHLKDMRKGTPTGLLTGQSDVTNQVALGAGMIDMPAVLHAAQQVGVQWYFIEDESPVSEEQIPQSLVYLRDVRR